jgi:hypothetical protein
MHREIRGRGDGGYYHIMAVLADRRVGEVDFIPATIKKFS